MGADLDPRFRPPKAVRPAIKRISRAVIEAARPAAERAGYALTVHGSLERDVDLVAVPWVEDASSPEELVEAVRAAVSDSVGTCLKAHGGQFGEKPHGRRAYTLLLVRNAVSTTAGSFPFVDLSVLPRA